MQMSKASGFESFKHTLRGGFLTKFKGQTVSCPPDSNFATSALPVSFSSFALATTVAIGLLAGSGFTAQAANLEWDVGGAGVVEGGDGDWDIGTTSNWTKNGGILPRLN